jgi:two-component system response regulator YesN
LLNAIRDNEDDSIVEHFVNDIIIASRSDIASVDDSMPAYEYISNNFTENISLTFLSGMSGCSVQTLINRFKIKYGKTPIKYVTELRIKKAKTLLSDTDLAIGHIGEICGWENVYYFSNTFKREVGVSPIKFRQSSRL